MSVLGRTLPAKATKYWGVRTTSTSAAKTSSSRTCITWRKTEDTSYPMILFSRMATLFWRLVLWSCN
ncbi:hypothetical protein ACOSQ4_019897 [Xanthoceras sorbifolium]